MPRPSQSRCWGRRASQALARDVYVTDGFTKSVVRIDTRSNQIVGSPIPVGTQPEQIGSTAYVANFGSGTVSVIDTGTNQAVGSLDPGGEGTGSDCDHARRDEGVRRE